MSLFKLPSVEARMRYMKERLEYSDEEISEMMDIYSETEIKEGWTVYWNAGEVLDALSVGVIAPFVDVCTADCDAANYYEKHNGKIIRDIPTDKYYIDTPENRKLVEDYVNRPEYHPVLSSAIKAGMIDTHHILYNVDLGSNKTVSIILRFWDNFYPSHESTVWNMLSADIYTKTEENGLNKFFCPEEKTERYPYLCVPLDEIDRFFRENGGIINISKVPQDDIDETLYSRGFMSIIWETEMLSMPDDT